jgi:1-phosphatidylinositol-4-phosphate 5-kinase
MLPKYYAHVSRHPGSLLARVLGMYTVRQQVFIVQANVLASELPMHEVYDLKGSTFGRSASECEKQAAFVVLKDNDFRSNPHRRLQLPPAARAAFLRQLEADVALLEDFGIIDYSVWRGAAGPAAGSYVARH